MVRVNYPPGGSMKLYGETTREPQTVRILKPPGGESSISFTDDAPRSAYRSNSVQQCISSPSSSDAKEPSFDSKLAEDKTDAPSQQNGSNGKHSPDSPVDPEPTSDVASENSSVVNESSDNPSEIIVNTPSTHTDTESTSISEDKVSVSECNVECETSSECKVETSTAEVSIETSSEIKSSSTESHHISKEEISSTQENDVHVLNGSAKANNDSSVNGNIESKQTSNNCENVNKTNLPPLAIHRDESSAQQPLSPTPSPSSPTKQNDDTRDRVFGQPSVNITPQPVQPRKIKDHMRSNIFMSDEDYTPTRSSRMNAATVNDPKHETPAAGQRQRIPPGGFSTKLW